MPKHPRTISLSEFKGINNVLRPENTPSEYLKEAVNVDIDKMGNISKREGYSKLDNQSFLSIYSDNKKCYAVRNNTLVKVNSDYTFTPIRSNVYSPLTFQELDGKYYYVGKDLNGVIINDVDYSFGVRKAFSPLLSYSSGSMVGGDYQVAYTYVDALGRESGTSIASKITIPDNSSIQFSIPLNSDPNIVKINVYCSNLNGTVLYYNQSSSLNTTVTIGSTGNQSSPLRTFNLDSAPYGSNITFRSGRMYIAQDNILWFSEPMLYEYYNLSNNYIEFSSEILEVLPVEDGMWICTNDGVYYMNSGEPGVAKIDRKECVKTLRGSAQKFSGSYVHLDNTPIGYKWFITTDVGIFVLFNQGLIINVTSQNVELDKADKATSLFLQTKGMNQYLTILNKNNKINNSVMGDTVTTEIIRNGINIG
jgi:hypothetical protein